jgi:hypothetical protein
VVWAQAKQDLFDAVEDAVSNECTLIFGTVNAAGIPMPGSNILVGGPTYVAMWNQISGHFPITLLDL